MLHASGIEILLNILSDCLTQVFGLSLIELFPLVLQSSESSKEAEECAAFEEARELLVAQSVRVAWSPRFHQNSEVLSNAIRALDHA